MRRPTIIEVGAREVTYHGFTQGFLNFVQNYFEAKQYSCQKCGTERTITIDPGPHIFFDVEYSMDKKTHAMFNKTVADAIPLSEITTKIEIEKTYILNGAVEFVSPANSDKIGHYIAHCRRLTGHWEIHNDLSKEVTRLTHFEKHFVKVAILLYARV